MGTISLKNISKSFGSTQVLKNLNVDIKDGEFLTLVGPSGCGKSTLLNIIAGLESINEGSVYIDDYNVSKVEPKDRNIAMVFQSYALYPSMNVRENMIFGLKQAKTSKEKIQEQPNRVCDLGCGSGFIALTSALLWPKTQITGIELSPVRADYAKRNVQDNELSETITILETDLRHGVMPNSGPFDLLLANPPFFPLNSGTLPPDPDKARARFEVDLDLKALLSVAESWMTPSGRICIVFPHSRKEELYKTARSRGLSIASWCPVYATSTSSPLLILVELSRQPGNANEDPRLILEDGSHQLGKPLRKFVENLAQSSTSQVS